MTPLPPKQGLKRRGHNHCVVLLRSYDTTSTKTRIETFPPHPYCQRTSTCYDTTSTKTRIETGRVDKSCIGVFPVMTPLPPKQGLKRRAYFSVEKEKLKVMTPLPPKQGLKQ